MRLSDVSLGFTHVCFRFGSGFPWFPMVSMALSMCLSQKPICFSHMFFPYVFPICFSHPSPGGPRCFAFLPRADGNVLVDESSLRVLLRRLHPRDPQRRGGILGDHDGGIGCWLVEQDCGSDVGITKIY